MIKLKQDELTILKGIYDEEKGFIDMGELQDLVDSFNRHDIESNKILHKLVLYGLIEKNQVKCLGYLNYSITKKGIQYFEG